MCACVSEWKNMKSVLRERGDLQLPYDLIYVASNEKNKMKNKRETEAWIHGTY